MKTAGWTSNKAVDFLTANVMSSFIQEYTEDTWEQIRGEAEKIVYNVELPKLVIQQNTEVYKNIAYGEEGFGYNGCGLASVVNAYVYKSGNTGNAQELIEVMASECERTKQYTFNSLSSTITNVFSKYLNIQTVAKEKGTYQIETVINHVKKGGVAILGSPNYNYYETSNDGDHFVALVAYRKKDGKEEFLMLDSAIENKIGTPYYTNMEGYGFVDATVVKKWNGGVNLVSFDDYSIKLGAQ